MTKANKVSLPKELTRKQQSRSEREAIQQRYLLIGVAAVLAVTVLLVLAGFIDQQVLKPRQPVAKVGNAEISTEAFQRRVRYQYLNIVNNLNRLEQQRAQFESDPQLSFMLDQLNQQQQQLQSQLANPAQVGQQVLNAMIDEELIRQEAAVRNITVSTAEIDQYIEEQFGYYRMTPTPAPTRTPLPTPSVPVTTTPFPTLTPAPTATPVTKEAFDSNYASFLSNSAQLAESLRVQLSQTEFRDLLQDEVKNSILRRKLQEDFTTKVDPNGDHLKLRYIRMETQPAVEIVGGLLTSGASFSQLYADVHSSKIISSTAAEVDWMLASDLEPNFGQAVIDQLMTLPITQTTGVITDTYGGSYILQVIGRESRPLTDSQKQSLGSKAFDDWLANQRQIDKLVDYMQDRFIEAVPPFKPQG